MAQPQVESRGRSTCRKQVTGTSASKIVHHNYNRIAIIFSPHTTNRCTIGNDSNIPDLGGMVIEPAGPPLQLDVGTYGPLVTDELWAIASGSGTNIGIVEVFQ